MANGAEVSNFSIDTEIAIVSDSLIDTDVDDPKRGRVSYPAGSGSLYATLPDIELKFGHYRSLSDYKLFSDMRQLCPKYLYKSETSKSCRTPFEIHIFGPDRLTSDGGTSIAIMTPITISITLTISTSAFIIIFNNR